MIETHHRIAELDGIRGIAILLVVVWHYVGCTVEPGNTDLAFFIWKGTSLAWCGVDLFFVLSGYLIGGLLLDNRHSPRLFRTFYLRRAARIFPLYYLFIIAAFSLKWMGLGQLSGSDSLMEGNGSITEYLLYLQNIIMSHTGDWGFDPLAVTWSLAVEEQFYLLFPLAIRFLPSQHICTFLVIGVVLTWITRIWLFHSHPHPDFATYTLLPSRSDSLLTGALLAWYVRNAPHKLSFFSSTRFIHFAFPAFIISAVILILLNTGPGSWAAAWLGYVVFSALGASLIGHSWAQPTSFLSGIWRSSWLRFLGTVSYGIYLFHEIVLKAVFWIFTGSSTPSLRTPWEIILITLAFAVTTSLAICSWFGFERTLVIKMRAVARY